MHKPRLLDLFAGAGGASSGYMQAGFHVTGVDHLPQPHYRGDVFVQADALEYLDAHGHDYAVIAASPPCQAYSPITRPERRGHYPTLVAALWAQLSALGVPVVIENVRGALREMPHPLLLCGTMFGLETPCGAQLRRHRLFQSNVLLLSPGPCQHGARTLLVYGHAFRDEAVSMRRRTRTIMVVGATPRDPARERLKYKTITVTGSTPQQNVVRNTVRETFSVKDARVAMGIDWMTMAELAQAIPPAFTCWVGTQILRYL